MAVSITPGQRAIVAMMAPEVREPKVVSVRPEHFSEARVKECYRNAAMYAVSHECDYVLGLLFYQGAVPIEHAWVHDPKRGHLDVTITKTEAAGAKHDGKSFYVELFRPRSKWVQWFIFKNSVAPSVYDVRKAIGKGQPVLEGSSPAFGEYVEEMAAITKVGKRIMADDEPLVKATHATVRDNIVILHHREGIPLLLRPGWTMAYFMRDKASADAVRDGTLDYLMFPFVRFGFGQEGPITRIWRTAPKEYLAAIEATVKGEIYVDMLSVRPGYRNNHVATLMMDALRAEWPALPVRTSHRTDKGEKFFREYLPGTPQD